MKQSVMVFRGAVLQVSGFSIVKRRLGRSHGDQAIPPDAQRQFAARMGATTVEVATNHVAMVSHPDDVLQLISTAVEAVQAAT
jgi:hypothetical protein